MCTKLFISYHISIIYRRIKILNKFQGSIRVYQNLVERGQKGLNGVKGGKTRLKRDKQG